MNDNLKTPDFIKRYSKNPVLTSADVPYSSTLTFNPGVEIYKDGFVMVFRNDYGNFIKNGNTFEGTNIGLAFSEDGINWKVQSEPCFEWKDHEAIRAYDPRLTKIDSHYYMCFALDTKHGIRGGIAVTDDFNKFEILHLTVPDNRNMVLFPEKINGKYFRLERPFPVYSRGDKDRFDIWLSESPDMIYWGNSKLLISVEDLPFANDKVGPAAPPVKTTEGWLILLHTVDRDNSRGKNGWEPVWQKRYLAGAALLSLDNPSKVLTVCKKPLIVPEVGIEIKDGFRNNVIFPTAALLDKNNQLKIYYGASDTEIYLATASLDDIIRFIKENALKE